MDVVVQRPISLHCLPQNAKSQLQTRRSFAVSPALPETAVSVAVAATFVGAAATLLVQRTKTSESTQIEFKECEACGGSGICPACKGEGYVLKKRSEESAEKARKLSKNMATRFTDGLPKKWSYCTKCSSGRNCSTCGGSGKLNL
ncbi:hypothetical protein MtrunA17_Chr4g0028521 [Medicago truncatula]|uniref:DUF7895 domain-containing protein n=1 Tax=Medicago truncatula TaxID=3880 RepID=A0A072UJY4_MEDTR|nr:uncharacterized protein LOC25492411 [Medicago truncatula]KEH30002.1 hypothetical protein MTR_4g057845 [Medicago truncatula]RHN60687.1 hypothetical protein MtrunA17_Chr4g0028521 [Medicago truncatula]